jgi:hypothetical protein
MLTKLLFFHCSKTGTIILTVEGDDKAWCRACGSTHDPATLKKASIQEMAAQIFERGKAELKPLSVMYGPAKLIQPMDWIYWEDGFYFVLKVARGKDHRVMEITISYGAIREERVVVFLPAGRVIIRKHPV